MPGNCRGHVPPCIFHRSPDQRLHAPDRWQLLQCSLVGAQNLSQDASPMHSGDPPPATHGSSRHGLPRAITDCGDAQRAVTTRPPRRRSSTVICFATPTRAQPAPHSRVCDKPGLAIGTCRPGVPRRIRGVPKRRSVRPRKPAQTGPGASQTGGPSLAFHRVQRTSILFASDLRPA